MAASDYTKTTHGIVITATPRFLPDESKPEQGRYFWAYTIDIANQSTRTVQLISRWWHITDGDGRSQDVRGQGVIGEQPVIAPQEQFSYTSGCPLHTPHGIMVGQFGMVDADGQAFDVDIPAFPLHSPHVNQVLN